MLYVSFSVGVKGWWGGVCTSGEPTPFLENIPQKSGTENFSKEICGNPLCLIYAPFTFRSSKDNTDSPQQWTPEMGHIRSKGTWLKLKKLKEWGSFNLISSQFKIARIPTGQFSNRILLLEMWPMEQSEQISINWELLRYEDSQAPS